MLINPQTARRLLSGFTLTLVKSRHLVMFDGDSKFAHSPFPYTKKFFRQLRKDQVPRFLRCLTDPLKLPLKDIDLSKLHAIQDRVDVAKVDNIIAMPTDKPPVVVKLRFDGDDYIVDGLHRLSADWLSGCETTTVHYADLSSKEMTVEPVPGAGKYDAAEERATRKL